MKYVVLIALAAVAGCSPPQVQVKPPSPTHKTLADIPTPLFNAHCKQCKQCGGGLLDENGNEQSLCDEGFMVWQKDMRNGSVR